MIVDNRSGRQKKKAALSQGGLSSKVNKFMSKNH